MVVGRNTFPSNILKYRQTKKKWKQSLVVVLGEWKKAPPRKNRSPTLPTIQYTTPWVLGQLRRALSEKQALYTHVESTQKHKLRHSSWWRTGAPNREQTAAIAKNATKKRPKHWTKGQNTSNHPCRYRYNKHEMERDGSLACGSGSEAKRGWERAAIMTLWDDAKCRHKNVKNDPLNGLIAPK